MKVTMEIRKGIFNADDGRRVVYYPCTALINGEKIRFTVRKEDKSLFDYLVRDCEIEEIEGESAEA